MLSRGRVRRNNSTARPTEGEQCTHYSLYFYGANVSGTPGTSAQCGDLPVVPLLRVPIPLASIANATHFTVAAEPRFLEAVLPFATAVPPGCGALALYRTQYFSGHYVDESLPDFVLTLSDNWEVRCSCRKSRKGGCNFSFLDYFAAVQRKRCK